VVSDRAAIARFGRRRARSPDLARSAAHRQAPDQPLKGNERMVMDGNPM